MKRLLIAVAAMLCVVTSSYAQLVPFPSGQIYVNPGLSAPPNQMIEFLVSPSGTDTRIYSPTKGFTPATAFATVQGCADYIYANFYSNGTVPVCRVMAGAINGGPIQITGPGPAGSQVDGGGQLIVWGTCPLNNSPNNGVVGYSAGPSDVTLISDPGKTLYSLINGAYVLVGCQTVSADNFVFYAQQQSNIFVTEAPSYGSGANGVTIIPGPTKNPISVFSADNMGQIYVGGGTKVATSTSSYLSVANHLSEIAFIAPSGGVQLIGTPSFGGATFYSGWNSLHLINNANEFVGAVSSPNKCIITRNGGMDANGTAASLPGGGICFVNTGGNVN